MTVLDVLNGIQAALAAAILTAFAILAAPVLRCARVRFRRIRP